MTILAPEPHLMWGSPRNLCAQYCCRSTWHFAKCQDGNLPSLTAKRQALQDLHAQQLVMGVQSSSSFDTRHCWQHVDAMA
jgi:hypothetical protein